MITWVAIAGGATGMLAMASGWLAWAIGRDTASKARERATALEAETKLAKRDAQVLRDQLNVTQMQITEAGRLHAEDARRFEAVIAVLRREIDGLQSDLAQCGDAIPAALAASRLRNIDRLLVVGPQEAELTDDNRTLGPEDKTPIPGLPRPNGSAGPPDIPPARRDRGRK